MAVPTQPFPLSRKLPPTLASIQQYWETLIRSENLMPFSDDVSLSRLPELSANLMLIDVFAGPQRFRFNYLGEIIVRMLDSNWAVPVSFQSHSRAPPGETLASLNFPTPSTSIRPEASVVMRGDRRSSIDSRQ
jgi:hypothetical protein